MTTRVMETNTATKWRNAVKQYKEEKKAHEFDNKTNSATIKTLSDENGVLLSEVSRLEKLLQAREEQESYIICKNEQGYITDLIYTPAYNERVSVQELNGINLLTITKTALYRKIPFLQEKEGNIEIDKKLYNKYKLGGTL